MSKKNVGFVNLAALVLLLAFFSSGCSNKPNVTTENSSALNNSEEASVNAVTNTDAENSSVTNNNQDIDINAAPLNVNVNSKTGNANAQNQNICQTYQVEIINFSFNPKTLNVKKCDTVIWTNKDQAPHQIISDSGTEINSATMSNGQEFKLTFNNAGTFNYYCSLHPGMKGSIKVE